MITFVRQTSASGVSNSPSVTATASDPGNLLVAVIAEFGATVATVNTLPSGFTQAAVASDVSFDASAAALLNVSYRANAPSTTTFSWSLSASRQWRVAVLEFSGVSLTSPLDKTATGTTLGSLSTAALATAPQIGIAAAFSTLETAITWAAGGTERVDTGGLGVASEYLLSTAAYDADPDMGLEGETVAAVQVLATFKDANYDLNSIMFAMD